MAYRGRAITEAVITALTVAGLRVGDGDKPATGAGWEGVAGQSSFRGYVVVHPIGAYDFGGSLSEPFADVWPLYQISSYGATQRQCEELSAKVALVMLTVTLVVAGRKVCLTQPDDLGRVTRFDDTQPPIFMAPDRYEVCTTAA